MRAVAALATLLLSLTGCGSRVVVDPPAGSEPSATAVAGGYEVEVVEPDVDDPPPVVLRLADGTTHDLAPWGFCLPGGCADGSWPEHPFDVGSPAWVDVTFGVPDWSFEATFTTPRRLAAPPREMRSWRSLQGRVEEIGRHTFRVHPAGPAGDWHVDLFGRGPGGDVIVTFAWTTAAAGDLPAEATAQAAVLAAPDGDLTTYGVELGLRDLDRTPGTASAVIEVVSDNGGRATLDLGAPDRPWQAGTVSWTTGAARARPAVALGGTRFTYVATVVLDGTTYTGTGVWPDDTDEEITPAVPLTFTPPLPVYAP